MRRWISLICLLALAWTVSISHATEATISIKTEPLGEISPYVFGANYGPWAVLPVGLWDQAAESGITFLRFPGGAWGDQNDLQSYHIDPFIKFARRLNAEPLIHVRLSGSTPERAAATVRYVNVEQKYGVRFWSIGNEPNLYKDYPASQFAKDWRAFALAMREVDPNIILVGPDISQYPPSPTDYHAPLREWIRIFMRENGDLVNIVSIHRYPLPRVFNAPPTTIAQLRETAKEWDFIVNDLRKVIREATGRDYPIGILEVSSHWSKTLGGEATPDSFFHAIWWADVLTRLINYRVDIVAYFMLASYGGTDFGLFDRYQARPTFYVYPLYKRFGKTLLPSQSSDPKLTVAAALNESGQLTVMVVNPFEEERTAKVEVNGKAACSVKGAWRLDAQHKAEPVKLETEAPRLVLPAYSATLYLLETGCR
ncbi:MAG: hypothetical protein RML95_14115 [Anaerolineae bacterium]|nr:hypothetical protein [Anaerolineae bacterium]MDW8300461.1 hypothetical protein [Anaerolineae bacterium]